MLVALVHGSMDRAASFSKVSNLLTDRGHTVVAFDRAGYASAVNDAPFTSVEAAAADLVARLEKHGASPAVVVGHSFGGHLAMLSAFLRPDLVRAVGVFETPYSWQPFWPPDTSGGKALRVAATDGPEAAGEAFLRHLAGDATWARLPETTKQLRRAEGRALVTDLSSIATAAPYDPRTLPVPLVAGRGSAALPYQVEGTNWIVSEVPGAAVVVIDGAEHGAHRSHPAEFAAFVERVVAAGMTPQTRA